MPYTDYEKALKAGKKDYHRRVADGLYPYLRVLDEALSQMDVASEMPLGLQMIPTELIAGTRTVGRRNSFAHNFMPLLNANSEFASKWIRLCDSHLEEGIREPVTACEFMGRFYIVEGNKRVSVLKYFGSPTIPAMVTRIVPQWSEDEDILIYYEYMDFHQHTGVNYVLMSKKGNYPALAELVGGSTVDWDPDLQKDFASFTARFQEAFIAKGGDQLGIHMGDALLTYLKIYSFRKVKDELVPQIKEELGKIWKELLLLENNSTVEVVMEPDAVETKKKLIHVLLPTRQKPLQIAFIHSKNADTSSWTYGHELGRRHVEQVFGDQIQTCLMDRVSPGEEAEAAITRAVDQGCRLIFTTTPEFLPASLKLAVEHPEVSIYNCSVNTAYHSIRTYYGRMYEAKFLCGMVAGALADNNRIGYIADYPIYGMTANINAFAFGARMVNPRAKVYLQWSSVKDQDSIAYFKEQQISYLSTQDMIVPQYASRQYGLYRFADLSGDEKDSTRNAAMPLWNWGQLYERIVQNSLNSTHEGMPDPGMKALNYWWGLATGTIDFIYNKDLEAGTKKLVEFFRRSMESGAFHPFEGRLESQEGVIQEEEWEILSPEEIITMDWLASNVIGRIPDYEELTDAAKAIVRLQGIKKQK